MGETVRIDWVYWQ